MILFIYSLVLIGSSCDYFEIWALVWSSLWSKSLYFIVCSQQFFGCHLHNLPFYDVSWIFTCSSFLCIYLLIFPNVVTQLLQTSFEPKLVFYPIKEMFHKIQVEQNISASTIFILYLVTGDVCSCHGWKWCRYRPYNFNNHWGEERRAQAGLNFTLKCYLYCNSIFVDLIPYLVFCYFLSRKDLSCSALRVTLFFRIPTIIFFTCYFFLES